MAKCISCGLNESKDKDLIDYMDSLNKVGMNNAAIMKIALYRLMNNGIELNNISISDNNSKETTLRSEMPKISHVGTIDNVQNKLIEEEKHYIEEPKTINIIEKHETIEKPIEKKIEHDIKDLQQNNAQMNNPFKTNLIKVTPKR